MHRNFLCYRKRKMATGNLGHTSQQMSQSKKATSISSVKKVLRMDLHWLDLSHMLITVYRRIETMNESMWVVWVPLWLDKRSLLLGEISNNPENDNSHIKILQGLLLSWSHSMIQPFFLVLSLSLHLSFFFFFTLLQWSGMPSNS